VTPGAVVSDPQPYYDAKHGDAEAETIANKELVNA
jgi:hypothetical protein